MAYQPDPGITSLVSTVPSSVIVGASIFGTVPIENILPGTGATNLGKAIDDPVGSTDTGIAMLGVHDAEASKITPAEEDYDHLHIGELGGLSVEPEQHNHLDEFDSTSGWAVLGNDADNLVTTTNHLTGTLALSFDKVDGAADTVFAGIDKTITTLNMGELDLHDTVQTACYLSSISLVDYVFIRIGTDNLNYNEWRVPDTELTADEWIILGVSVGSADFAGNTGNGVDWSSLKYIAVGVAFDNAANLLSEIRFDQLGIFTSAHTTSREAEVTTAINTPNVNLHRVAGTPTDANKGNAAGATQRVVLATDSNATSISGRIEALQQGTWNNTQAGLVHTSLVSTVPSSVIVGASIFGQLPAGTAPLGSVATLQGTNPWAVTNVGSIITLNKSSVITVSKDSSVFAVQSGTWNNTQAGTVHTSLVSTVPSSVIVGASIFGLPPVNVTNTNLNVGGSVVGFQGGTWNNTQAGTVFSSVVGDVAHDTADGASSPIKMGAKAISLSADPGEVAGDDRTDIYATRAGQLFVATGHPNILTKQLNITDADGAQTDTNLLAALVGANDIAIVTGIMVACDDANTGAVQYRIGFGATNTPGNDAAAVVSSHPGVPAGSGGSSRI